MKIMVKNWKTFQHYNHRNPPWIKLHKALLDDCSFNCLHDASKWLLLRIWMLASEYQDGVIEANFEQILFRLRTTEKVIEAQFSELQNAGFITVICDASNMLASCKQNATTELEKEKEKEKKESKRFVPPTVSEVELYMKEIGYNGNAQNFVDSNTAKGWVIGKLKTPAKDWKAMVRTWKGNGYGSNIQATVVPVAPSVSLEQLEMIRKADEKIRRMQDATI